MCTSLVHKHLCSEGCVDCMYRYFGYNMLTIYQIKSYTICIKTYIFGHKIPQNSGVFFYIFTNLLPILAIFDVTRNIPVHIVHWFKVSQYHSIIALHYCHIYVYWSIDRRVISYGAVLCLIVLTLSQYHSIIMIIAVVLSYICLLIYWQVCHQLRRCSNTTEGLAESEIAAGKMKPVYTGERSKSLMSDYIDFPCIAICHIFLIKSWKILIMGKCTILDHKAMLHHCMMMEMWPEKRSVYIIKTCYISRHWETSV